MDGLITASKDWGEICEHPNECYDHRMTCLKDENSVSRCTCGIYYKWNGTEFGCIQIYSVEYIMNQTVSGRNNKERLTKLQDLMFQGPIYSVAFMVFVIGVCTLSIVAYCFYIRKKDKRLMKEVRQMREDLDERKRKPISVVTTV